MHWLIFWAFVTLPGQAVVPKLRLKLLGIAILEPAVTTTSDCRHCDQNRRATPKSPRSHCPKRRRRRNGGGKWHLHRRGCRFPPHRRSLLCSDTGSIPILAGTSICVTAPPKSPRKGATWNRNRKDRSDRVERASISRARSRD